MGDHRTEIKIEFTAHGKTYRQEWSINYFDNGDGIDQRIVDWFRACWEDAYARYNKAVQRHYAKEDVARLEREERAELARLIEKYEGRG